MRKTLPDGYFDFILGYDCNALCPFCSQDIAWRRRPAATFRQAVQTILNARRDGYSKIGLLGGEVTLRDDLDRLIRIARKCGFKSVRILTNGIRLGDKDYAERLVHSGLNVVHLSIHGHNAALHDRLVRVPGAFNKVARAIDHLREMNAHVGVKILVNKVNAAALPEIVRYFVSEKKIKDLGITYPLFTGDFLNHIAEMAIPFSDVLPYVRQALAVFHELLPRAESTPSLHNFPPCQLPEFLSSNSELRTDTYNVGRPAENGGGEAPKRQVSACSTCAQVARCPGIDIGYLIRFGEQEILPLALPGPEASAMIDSGLYEAAVRELARRQGKSFPGSLFLPESPDARQDLLIKKRRRSRPRTASGDRAMLILDEAVRREPSSAQLHVLRGAVLSSLGRFTEALTALNVAVTLAPKMAQVYLWRAIARNAALRKGRAAVELVDLKEDLDRAIELDPKDCRAYVWRAEVLHDLEAAEPALADLERALQLDPKHIWARVERADILSELNRQDESMKEFGHLLRRFPQEGWLYALRGRARSKKLRWAEALSDFNRSLALDPGMPNAYAWRGELHRRTGRLDLAWKDLSQAIRMTPQNAYARWWRANILLMKGQWSRARRELNTAIRHDSRHLNLFAARGQASFMLSRFKDAVRDFDRVHPLNPRSTWIAPGGHRDRGRALFSALDNQVRRHPKSGLAVGLRGRLRMEAKDADELIAGLRDLNVAVRLNGKMAWTHAWRGEALRRLGRRDSAVRDLDAAVSLDPNWGWAWAWRGRIKEEQGYLEEARKDFEQAFQREPEASWILAQLGRLRVAAGNELGKRDLKRARYLEMKA